MSKSHPALKAIKSALGRQHGGRINIYGALEFVLRFGPIARATYRVEWHPDRVTLEPVHHFLISWQPRDEDHKAEFLAFEEARAAANARGILINW